MPKRTWWAAAFIVMCIVPSASAGVFSDDMSRCLVRSATREEQTTLIRWMFASLALNPDVASLSAITADQRDEINRKAADMFRRLLLNACHDESVLALKNEGAPAIEVSFSALGQSAARGLMTDPQVVAGLRNLQQLDKDVFVQLVKDAGLPQ
jgi:hypothetical protein